MAIIYHNYLLAIGSRKDIKALRDFLVKPQEAAVFLSCEMFTIYVPDKPRSRRLKDFGNCGQFWNTTTPWDIAMGMDQIQKIHDVDYGVSLMKMLAENEYSKDDDNGILYFTFASGHSEPDEGFKKLSKQYPEVQFFVYFDSEDGTNVLVRIKKGKWRRDRNL